MRCVSSAERNGTAEIIPPSYLYQEYTGMLLNLGLKERERKKKKKKTRQLQFGLQTVSLPSTLVRVSTGLLQADSGATLAECFFMMMCSDGQSSTPLRLHP